MMLASTIASTHRLPVWVAFAIAAWLGAAPSARAAEPAEPAPIRFAPGASSAQVQGAVVRGERALYTLEARAGQRLTLRIAASEGNAAFQLYAPGARPQTRDFGVGIEGQALSGASEGEDARRWMGTLPQTGAYLLVVGPTRGNATYRLTVAIR